MRVCPPAGAGSVGPGPAFNSESPTGPRPADGPEGRAVGPSQFTSDYEEEDSPEPFSFSARHALPGGGIDERGGR